MKFIAAIVLSVCCSGLCKDSMPLPCKGKQVGWFREVMSSHRKLSFDLSPSLPPLSADALHPAAYRCRCG